MKQSSLQNYFKKPRLEGHQDSGSRIEDVLPSTSRPTTPPSEPTATHTIREDYAANAAVDEPNTASSGIPDLSFVDEPACQPNLQAFPVTEAVSGKKRNFSTKWYARYSWLEYSIKLDAVFCQSCRHFSRNDKADRFTNTGMRDWG